MTLPSEDEMCLAHLRESSREISAKLKELQQERTNLELRLSDIRKQLVDAERGKK